MIPQGQKDRLRSITISIVGRFLAVAILSSFAATLLPIASTSAESSTMPCCVGKTEGHCDSGLTTPKPRPRITEPMCGLTPPPESPAEVAVVTDPIAVDSVSGEQECQMECGACATATSRHKRQKSLTHSRTAHHPPAIIAVGFDSSTSLYSSNGSWTRINPRGPPARV